MTTHTFNFKYTGIEEGQAKACEIYASGGKTEVL
jgi:hypothetical protein